MGRDHVDSLKTRCYIANWTEQLGDGQEALRLFAELLPDQERVLGHDHADTLWIRNCIAYWTGEIGQRAGGPAAVHRTAERSGAAAGPRPQDALRHTRQHRALGGPWGRAARGAAAVRRAPAGLERVLGRDHPDTLTTRKYIADWTAEAGDAREALRLHTELLPDQERVLGRDHADTLDTRYDIASCTGELGEAPEALRLFAELLADQERSFGTR